MRISKKPRQVALKKMDALVDDCEDLGIDYETAWPVMLLMFDAVNYCYDREERENKERFITAEAVFDLVRFMEAAGEPLKPGGLEYLRTWPVEKIFKRVTFNSQLVTWIRPDEDGWQRICNLRAIIREISLTLTAVERKRTSGGVWVAINRGWRSNPETGGWK